MEDNNVILKPELGSSFGDIVERVERGAADPFAIEAGLSVGQSCPPFGGRARASVTSEPLKRPGVSVGQAVGGASLGGCANNIVGMLNRIGAPACRVWGAEAPMGRDANGCPRQRKVCGAIYPYNVSVGASAVQQVFNMFAKVWFWPVFWADSSESFIRVANMTWTGDPVFENGRGSGPLNVPALFGASSFYGFVPGMPAFDNSVPLVALLNNLDAGPRIYRGMFVGISIRN